MYKAKPMNTPLIRYFKLCSKKIPISEKEKQKIKTMTYASLVDSLVSTMVCTKPDITYVVGVMSRFLTNSGNEH